MKWIKNIILDIVITAALVVLAIFKFGWLELFMMFYTPLMVVLKVAVFFNKSMILAAAKQKDATPMWVMHLIYGVNTFAMIYGQFWILAAEWGAIWLFSWLTDNRIKKSEP